MNKETFLKAVKFLKENAPKRKFDQSYEFVINLKNLDLKKPEQHVELFLKLPHSIGKEVKVAALVGGEMIEQAKKDCDFALVQDDFGQYDGKKKEIKKLAKEHNYFIAQANIMPAVAKTFGRVLGPLGKMPNPKAGCVVPPNANLATISENLKKTIKVSAKVQPSIKLVIGTQKMADEEIVDNMQAIFSSLVHSLPQEKNNIKSVLLKLTMSPPVKIGDKDIEVEAGNE